VTEYRRSGHHDEVAAGRVLTFALATPTNSPVASHYPRGSLLSFQPIVYMVIRFSLISPPFAKSRCRTDPRRRVPKRRNYISLQLKGTATMFPGRGKTAFELPQITRSLRIYIGPYLAELA
jgi:hypothetical protein